MIPKGKLVAVDTEGTGLNCWTGAETFAVSFCNDVGHTGYMRWAVDPVTRKVNYYDEQLNQLLKFFNDTSIRKVFHNAQYDIRMFWKMGVIDDAIIGGDWFDDTMFASSLCNSLEFNRGLKPLSKKYMGFSDLDEKELHKSTVAGRRKGKKLRWNIAEKVQADYWLADPELCKEYAVKDAVRTMKLWLGIYKPWLTQRGAWEHYDRELKVFWSNWRMMGRGVVCDEQRLEHDIELFTQKAIEHREKVFEYVGYRFEINKKEQLRTALFDPVKGLGLPVLGKTKKTKLPSTSWKVIEKIDHPIIHHICEHDSYERSATSMKLYKKLLVKEKHYTVIHPFFDQFKAKTGRQASRQPNLQNVPNAETSLNRHTKSARAPYGPRPGYHWYCFDYSQQEAFIFAFFVWKYTGDKSLINKIAQGQDPYAVAANLSWGNDCLYWSKLFDVSPNQAEKLMRQFNNDVVAAEKKLLKTKTTRGVAKSIWLGITYGMGIAACAAMMGKDEDSARIMISQLNKAIPSMQEFNSIIKQKVKDDGHVETWFGRKIDVDPYEPYKGINYMVQGTAADQVKMGMIAVDSWLDGLRKRKPVDCHTVLAIHDELVFEILKEHASLPLLRGIKKKLEIDYFPSTIRVKCERVRIQWDAKESIKL